MAKATRIDTIENVWLSKFQLDSRLAISNPRLFPKRSLWDVWKARRLCAKARRFNQEYLT